MFNTLIFQGGTPNNTMICVIIIIIDDLRIEGEEIFHVTLFSADLDVFFSTNTTIIVIMDDEGIICKNYYTYNCCCITF